MSSSWGIPGLNTTQMNMQRNRGSYDNRNMMSSNHGNMANNQGAYNAQMMNQGNGSMGYQNRDQLRYQGDRGYSAHISSNDNRQSSPDEFETGVPLFIENFSEGFDVMTKLCGRKGENLDYIEKTTGARLTLRGRGTGCVDLQTGRPSNEPAQIIIKHSELKGLELTEQLVESLLKSVQEDYQEHLEREYKSMENILGLQGGGGVSRNNSSLLGEPPYRSQMSPGGAMSNPTCRDEEMYAIHIQKLQDVRSRESRSSSDGRSSKRKELMSKTTKRELEDTFQSLLWRQLQPSFLADLHDRYEIMVTNNGKRSGPQVPMRSLNKNYCIVCNQTVTDIAAHLWSRYHRETYLMMQLKYGLKRFSQIYGEATVPDMDTDGGRRLAVTSLDMYFGDLEGLPADFDAESYKEMVLLLGALNQFECKICDMKLRDEIKWVSHTVSSVHQYKCITNMMDMGCAEYKSCNADVPSLTPVEFGDSVKKYFDVAGENEDYSESWSGAKDSEAVGLGLGGEWSGGSGDADYRYNTTKQQQATFHAGSDVDMRQPGFHRSRSRSPVSGANSGYRDDSRRSRFSDDRQEGRRNRKSRWQDEDIKPVQASVQSMMLNIGSGVSTLGGQARGVMGGMNMAQSVMGPSLMAGQPINMSTQSLSLSNQMNMAGNMSTSALGMSGQNLNIRGVSMSMSGPAMSLGGPSGGPVVGMGGPAPNPGRGLLGDGAKALIEQGIPPNGSPTMMSMRQMGSGQMGPGQMGPGQMGPNQMQGQFGNPHSMMAVQGNASPLMNPMMQQSNVQALRAQGAAAIQAVMGRGQDNLSMTDRALVSEVQRLTGIKDTTLVIKALEVLSSLGPNIIQAMGNINSINLLVAQLSAVVRPNQKGLIQPLVQALHSGNISPQAVMGFGGQNEPVNRRNRNRRN